MKKNVIFHYFIQKVAEKTQELLNLDDKKAAQLAVIYTHPCLFRRHISGCSMDYYYGFVPEYIMELFLILAADAEKHGDHLLQYFDFKPTTYYFKGKVFKALSDAELLDHLKKELYPVVLRTQVDRDVYKKLFKAKTDADLDSILVTMETGNTRSLSCEIPEIPADEDALKMIDRAWERMDSMFFDLLIPEKKIDKYADSEAYKVYMKDYDFLKSRL